MLYRLALVLYIVGAFLHWRSLQDLGLRMSEWQMPRWYPWHSWYFKQNTRCFTIAITQDVGYHFKRYGKGWYMQVGRLILEYMTGHIEYLTGDVEYFAEDLGEATNANQATAG